MAKECICGRCGTISAGKTETKGSFVIELLLWLCFIVPGLIYSFWRLSSRHKVCRSCGSTELIPVDSPNGQRLARQFSAPTPQ